MDLSLKRYLAFFSVLTLAWSVFGQEIQISLGPDEIGQNQAWTITVTVQNDRLKSYDNFPDIQGFRKRGTSTRSETSIVNGQISSSQSVVMTYMPTRQGTFTVPSFKMKVNDKFVSSSGKKVKVGAPVQTQQRDPFRSFFERDDYFGRGDTEFVDVKEDAFLALTADKSEVFVGEGFDASLSFYVAENNRAPLQFYELGKQLSAILKKIKPGSCWEENFNIENIEPETVSINGKLYSQYKLYEATFYPLNAQPIVFPSVGLEMIKFRVAKNPSFFGQNRQEDFKTFYSREKRINVKELPPHPLRDQVAVGNYRLDENITGTALETGKSFSYDFKVYGEGNVSAIDKPILFNDGSFDFYEPNVRQSINRQNGRVTGAKTFSYFIIPKEPGEYPLSDYFQWIYFNPTKRSYDTLKATASIVVKGESLKNEAIGSTDPGVFYDKITLADNALHARSDPGYLRWGMNTFIFLMLMGSAYLVFRKPG